MNRQSKRLVTRFPVLALAIFGVAVTARDASATSWLASASGPWSTPANWTAGVPDANTDVVFPSSGMATLTEAAFCRDLAIDSASLSSVFVTSAGNMLAARDLSIGLTGNANLQFSGGGQFSTGVNSARGYDLIGNHNGTTGTLTVTGAGTLYAANNVFVAGSGVGNLYLSGGAAMTVNQLSLGTGTLGRATLFVLGSSLSAGNIDIGGTAVASVGTATVSIDATASVVSAGRVRNWNNGDLTVAGSLRANSLTTNVGNFAFTTGAIELTGGLFTPRQTTAGIRTADSTFAVSAYGALLTGVSGSTARPTLSLANGSKIGLTAGNDVVVGDNGGSATLNIDGPQSALSTGTTLHTLYVGAGGNTVGSRYYAGTGLLTLSHSTQILNTDTTGGVVIGYYGGSGRINVDAGNADGTASRLTTSNLAVGSLRYGTAGARGNGTLSVTAGAQTTVTGTTEIGRSGGTGLITVDGGPTNFSTANLYIGYRPLGEGGAVSSFGTGTIALTNGGQATSSSTAIIGQYDNGSATVDSGAKLIVGGSLTVGGYSPSLGSTTGTVAVTNGGTLATGTAGVSTASIGNSGAIGSVSLSSSTGNLSTWTNNGPVQLGGLNDLTSAGTGTLDIGPGGYASFSGNLSIYASSATASGQSGGKVVLHGGTLSVPGVLNGTTYANHFVFTDGVLRASANDMAVTVPIAVGPAGGTFDTNGFNATVSRAITDTSPGGTVTKQGNGTLSLTAANAYTGVTTVNGGTLTLNALAYANVFSNTGGVDVRQGTLALDYGTASTPVGTVRAALASHQFRTSLGTGDLAMAYRDNGTGKITLLSTLLGDSDLDGGVSINDFNALAGHFGQTSDAVWTTGDFDYDGGVSINDFNLLATNFGKSIAGGSPTTIDFSGLLAFAAAHHDLPAFAAATGVPEPSVIALAATACMISLRQRVRRGSGKAIEQRCV